MKYLILSCLSFMMWGCHIASSTESAIIDPQNSNTVAANSGFVSDNNLEGLYFGTSDNQLGQRAWLLSLDLKRGKGRFYMPPNNLELSDVKLSSTGRLTFRSAAGLGDVVYSFDGQITSDGINGVFQITRVRPSAKEDIGTAPVTLRKLEARLNQKQAADISGLYSNVEYNEEGGDLVGEELILIPYRERLIGVFTSYQNEMLPYAVDISQAEGKLRFKTRTESAEESYQGTLSLKRLILRRDDVNTDPAAKPMVLIKRKSLLDILVRSESSKS